QSHASTFDPEPFEPQPDGGHTIFPFWVPRSNNGSASHQGATNNASPKGYVELPYTLPQDSTLFLVLRETTPEIWMRKLDWIAQHGGMVLLDANPDYMWFSGSRAKVAEEPAALYGDLIAWVKTRYAGQYWHAIPREVAG